MKLGNVNNIPEWALDKYYIVVTRSDDEWWFYDAWDEDEDEKAMDQAWEVDGELRRVKTLLGRR